MNRQSIVVGSLGIVVGFIFGYFLALGIQPGATPSMTGGSADSGLPENHPSPEVMQQLQALLEQAQANPEDSRVRVALGNTYYDMNRFDAAIPWYEEAMKLNPSDVHVSTDLGTAYLYQGQTEKAIQRYQESLIIEPNHPQTLQNLGIAYFTEGDYQEAMDIWNRLIDAHPNYPQAEEIRNQIKTAEAHLKSESS
jgi:cytochrome c-type biogenesis protein CcmH/NrfG